MQSAEDTFSIQTTELDDIVTMIADQKNPNQHFLIITRVKEQMKQRVVELRLTNCGELYLEADITEELLLEHRKAIQFDGNWAAFLGLLRQALRRENKGGVEVQNVVPGVSAELKLIYPVSETIKIEGRLTLKSVGSFTAAERASRVQKMVCDMYTKLDGERRRLEARVEELQRRARPEDSRPRGAGEVGAAGSPHKLAAAHEDKKRKYRGNLINPNVKKKKQAMGAKIATEEDS